MKNEKIENALWLVGLILALSFLAIGYFVPAIKVAVPIIWILTFGGLSIFYFFVKEKRFVGTLLFGYAIIILLTVLNVISNDLLVTLYIVWTIAVGLSYALFFGVLSYFLIRRLRWNDSYHKKIKEEARIAREEKEKAKALKEAEAKNSEDTKEE